MTNWKKAQIGTLLQNYDKEMVLLNEWCKKNGIDPGKAAVTSQNYGMRLVDFSARLGE